MHPSNSESSRGAPADESFIERELLAVVLGQAHISAAGNLVVGGISAIVLQIFGRATAVLWAWITILTLITAARWWYSKRAVARFAQLDRAGLDAIERALTTFITLTGACWGLLSWIGYTGENAFVDFYTVAMLLGMVSSGAALIGALPRALLLYLGSALLPTVLRALQIGGAVSFAGAAAAIFAGVVLWNFGRSTHRSLRRNLQLSLESQRLGSALRHERDALAAAMRAKDLFQAGVTHDLRQPVHAMALHLHYLRSLWPASDSDRGASAAWSAVETSLQRISSQLLRLLDLSRLESGELRPSIESIELQPLLAECHNQFAARAAAKGIELRLRNAAIAVRSDVRMLQSILDNLVSNAVRHTDNGGVLVGVRRRGANAEIHVYDTGRGIPAHFMPELFVAYRRFDDRDRGDGHGLGLALVKKQAELLGHRIVVRSVAGRGSVFGVTVPVA